MDKTSNGRYNLSRRDAIVGDKSKNEVYFYWGSTLLATLSNFDEVLSCNRIEIQFKKYKTYNTSPMYVESVYAGEPLYYSSVLE